MNDRRLDVTEVSTETTLPQDNFSIYIEHWNKASPSPYSFGWLLHCSLNTSILATFVCKFSRLHVQSLCSDLDFFKLQKDSASWSWSDSGSHFIFFCVEALGSYFADQSKTTFAVLAMAKCQESLLSFSHSKAIWYHIHLSSRLSGHCNPLW